MATEGLDLSMGFGAGDNRLRPELRTVTVRAAAACLHVGVELALGVHDGLVDLGGLGGEAGHAHEIAVAAGVERGLADLDEIVAEVFDELGSNFGFHGLCKFPGLFFSAQRAVGDSLRWLN